MQIGVIGLGRMGSNMVKRWMRGGHQCVVFDLHADAVAALVKGGRYRRGLNGRIRSQARTPARRLDDGAGGRRGCDATRLEPADGERGRDRRWRQLLLHR